MVDVATADPKAGTAPNTKRVPMNAAQALDMAGKLYSEGKFPQAEHLARQILKNHPNNADIYNILGVCLNAQGKPKEAIECLNEALKRAPNHAIFYANIGEIERQRGRTDAARKALTKAVALDPKQASAHNNLGIMAFDAQKFQEAFDCYQRAVEANPSFAEAYNNLGNVSRFLGKADLSLGFYHKALQFKEIYPEAYNNLGSLLRDQGKIPEAEHAFRKAMMQNPNYIDAYNNLANLLVGQNKDVDALRVLGDALRIQENNPATLTIVARVQLRRANYEAAQEAARRALVANPKSSDAMVVLGQLYHETDRFDEAVKILGEAIEIAPEAAEARNYYGVALKSIGRLEEGKEQILKAIDINVNNFGAYANLNDLVDFKEEPKLVENMRKIFDDAPDKDDPRLMPLHFGYAKALDDLGEHPKALEHYIIGAKQKRATLSYDEKDTSKFFGDIKAAFPAEMFKNRPFPGLPNDQMIFIVGMPRSGSTLVEQILSAHPDVFGAGEVKHFARALTQMRDRFPSMSRFPAMVSEMEPFHYDLAGNAYLKSILPMAGPKAKKITDKLLTNYFFVGLLHLIFPNAKFVHTHRNPVDTCFSAFTKLFKDDMPHSYDFGELGRYYLEYRALMNHWHDVLPAGTILDVKYEDVVADVEGKARELIDFVGLEWDPACVEFHKSTRPVKTASVAQVRKPVYTASVERWRRYGPGLQPLADALGYVPEDAPGKEKASKKPATEPAAKKASRKA
jgi:tetratricopeptide (TPR) repeat protein